MANYTLLLNVNLENLYKRSLAKLKAIKAKTCIEDIAQKELIASLELSLAKGIGNNPNYTHKGLKKVISANLRQWENGKIELLGLLVKKTIIERGVHKRVNKRDKTIAKDKLRKELKMSKLRTFKINPDNISQISNDGKVLIIK